MKLSSIFIFLCTAIVSAEAFVNRPQAIQLKVESPAEASTTLDMGLFDFFSPEAKKAREEKRQREIEEQERMQKAIMERRRNPELMEEYERKVQIRRELRMRGDNEAASQVDMYEGLENQTLLDGSDGKFGAKQEQN